MNCYPFIEAEKVQQRDVKRAYELLKVSRAAYYAARDAACRVTADRQDAGLTVLITAEHKQSRGRYGARRIHAELRHQGHRHSRKRVARLMRQAGLHGRDWSVCLPVATGSAAPPGASRSRAAGSGRGRPGKGRGPGLGGQPNSSRSTAADLGDTGSSG